MQKLISNNKSHKKVLNLSTLKFIFIFLRSMSTDPAMLQDHAKNKLKHKSKTPNNSLALFIKQFHQNKLKQCNMIITDLTTLTLTIYYQILCAGIAWYEKGFEAHSPFHSGLLIIQGFNVPLLESLSIKQH